MRLDATTLEVVHYGMPQPLPSSSMTCPSDLAGATRSQTTCPTPCPRSYRCVASPARAVASSTRVLYWTLLSPLMWFSRRVAWRCGDRPRVCVAGASMRALPQRWDTVLFTYDNCAARDTAVDYCVSGTYMDDGCGGYALQSYLARDDLKVSVQHTRHSMERRCRPCTRTHPPLSLSLSVCLSLSRANTSSASPVTTPSRTFRNIPITPWDSAYSSIRARTGAPVRGVGRDHLAGYARVATHAQTPTATVSAITSTTASTLRTRVRCV